MVDLVDDEVQVGPHVLRLRRPRDADTLIDESRFGDDEFMPYWAELWPSSLNLARVVAQRDLRGASVVELGCGLALPSLVAALGGAHALATDWAPEAIGLARTNAERNGVDLEAAVVSWDQPDALLERAPFDLVLCSDVLYEGRNVAALLALLPRLGSEVLLAEPGRQTAGEFFVNAERDWTIGREGDVSRLTAN